MQVAPRGVGRSDDRARRAAEEARAAARKMMSARSSTGTDVSRRSRASFDKRGGGVVEVGSKVEPTEEFRQRWSGGGSIPKGGVVEQVSDEAVVVKGGDGSSFAFNPSDVSLITADKTSRPMGKEDGTGGGWGSRGAEAGAQVDGRGESGTGRKGGKRENDKAKAPIGKGWAFDMYEKKQQEIRKIKEMAAARRGRIEGEKKEAKDRRKMWRKKLGAKTRRGQPVMQVVCLSPAPPLRPAALAETLQNHFFASASTASGILCTNIQVCAPTNDVARILSTAHYREDDGGLCQAAIRGRGG